MFLDENFFGVIRILILHDEDHGASYATEDKYFPCTSEILKFLAQPHEERFAFRSVFYNEEKNEKEFFQVDKALCPKDDKIKRIQAFDKLWAEGSERVYV